MNSDGNGEVFRLNLEIGRYMRGYEVDVGGDDLQSAGAGALQGGIATGSVNVAAIAEDSHNLLAFGTSLGTVEFWDSRARAKVGVLALPSEFEATPEVTALDFHQSGLTLAAGSSSGLIHLYDLRSPVPLLKKDQGYGFPIQNLTFLTPSTASRGQASGSKIMSADKKIIKLWDTENGAPWTSVEPEVDLNSVAWCKDNGMILTANEGRQQHAFFIPQLGPAPMWCSFLDSLVEEMAEDSNDPNSYKGGVEVYDNYKFLTMPQLKALNLDHLVGKSNLLRPYMHGYFVAQRLYEEARLIADPFVWEEERAKRIKEKIDKERETRIRGNTNTVKVKVNKTLAERVIAREEKRRTTKSKREPAAAKEGEVTVAEERHDLLKDSRFSALFQDEEYAVDEQSKEFQMLNPSTKTAEARGRTAAEDEEEEIAQRKQWESSEEDDDDDQDDSDDDGRRQAARQPPRRPEPQMRISTSAYKKSGHVSQLQPSAKGQSRDRSIGSRIAKPARTRKTGGAVGDKEITFSVGRKTENSAPKRRRDEGRRSASGNVFRRM